MSNQLVPKNGINEYLDKSRNEINIYNLPIEPKKINKIRLIACGTAYHSCLIAKYWIEEFTSLDVDADIASEFRYRNVKLNTKDLYIFVSQSGETADTYAALEKCKKNKVKNVRYCECSRKFNCKIGRFCFTYTCRT